MSVKESSLMTYNWTKLLLYIKMNISSCDFNNEKEKQMKHGFKMFINDCYWIGVCTDSSLLVFSDGYQINHEFYWQRLCKLHYVWHFVTQGSEININTGLMGGSGTY